MTPESILSRLSPGQRRMLEDGCPLCCLIQSDEPAEPRRLPPSPSIQVGKIVAEDPTTARVRAEMETAALARRERALAKKRDDEAIRKRMLRNVALVKAGVVAPEPIKIVRVVDLSRNTPASPEAQPQETEMAKAAKKAAKKANQKLPVTYPANRGPKRRAKSGAHTPIQRVEVHVLIAAMMKRPGGASMEEMVAATGIEAHPMRAKIKLVRDRLGLATEAPSKENGRRYYIRAAKKAEG